jgi:hypothetical protein
VNNKFRRSLVGFFYGLILSLICSFFIAIFANSVAGESSFAGWSWFFLASCIPFSISFGISGYFFAYKNSRKAKYWMICGIIGFINVLYMGTIGAIMGSAVRYSMENVNVAGYLVWGPVYAVLFLPLSTLVVAGLMKGLRNVLDIKKLQVMD